MLVLIGCFVVIYFPLSTIFTFIRELFSCLNYYHIVIFHLVPFNFLNREAPGPPYGLSALKTSIYRSPDHDTGTRRTLRPGCSRLLRSQRIKAIASLSQYYCYQCGRAYPPQRFSVTNSGLNHTTLKRFTITPASNR